MRRRAIVLSWAVGIATLVLLRTVVVHVTPRQDYGSQSFAVDREPRIDCSREHTFVIYVLTAPYNGKLRALIRETWGRLDTYSRFPDQAFNLQLIFVMGRTSVSSDRIDHVGEDERGLRDELARYDDILIGDFIDSYDMLVMKGVTTLRWLDRVCGHLGHVDFVMKVDDDVIPNMFALLGEAWECVAKGGDEGRNRKQRGGSQVAPVLNVDTWPHFLCLYLQEKPVLRTGKWGVTDEEYAAGQYPSYCKGALYIISRRGLPHVLEGINATQFFRMEDVYMTGLTIANSQLQGKAKYRKLRWTLVDMDKDEVIEAIEEGMFYRHTFAHDLPRRYWKRAHQQAVDHFL